MQLPELSIGPLRAKIPIIQGGMAVRVSTAPLAAAVADQGGIGIIAGSGIPVEELREQIRLAKSLTNGIVGVNIMVALKAFKELVDAAIEEKTDLIIAGAGFSRDLFEAGQKSGTPIIPIVSSERLAKTAEKLGAAALVVEGKEAGGHLGTVLSVEELVPRISAVVDIPVIAAGGITSGADIVNLLKKGASGVQIATRFVLSKECEVSPRFKEIYLNAHKDETIIIRSPVGMPGRALTTEFSDKVMNFKAPPPEYCDDCLKKCTTEYCILNALENARVGNVENGVVFSGENVYKIKEILSVKEIMDKFIREALAEDQL